MRGRRHAVRYRVECDQCGCIFEHQPTDGIREVEGAQRATEVAAMFHEAMDGAEGVKSSVWAICEAPAAFRVIEGVR